MKKTLTAAFLIVSIIANAQINKGDSTTYATWIDSSKIVVPITLKAEYHFLIVDLLDGASKPEWVDYVKQVARVMDTTYKPNKPLTVTMESGLLLELCTYMSAAQERYAANLNSDLRNGLLPQLVNYPWAHRELRNLIARNLDLSQQRKLRGFELLKRMR